MIKRLYSNITYEVTCNACIHNIDCQNVAVHSTRTLIIQIDNYPVLPAHFHCYPTL